MVRLLDSRMAKAMKAVKDLASGGVWDEGLRWAIGDIYTMIDFDPISTDLKLRPVLSSCWRRQKSGSRAC